MINFVGLKVIKVISKISKLNRIIIYILEKEIHIEKKKQVVSPVVISRAIESED